jgi:hypothetical protein
MLVRISIIAGVIAGVLLAGTALACNEYTKPKVEKASIQKNTDQEFKPCKLEVTDSPKIHNPHCKPSPTLVVNPKVTPTPTATPKSTPTSVGPATPKATPTPPVSSTPAVKTNTTTTVSAPATLPSVGGSGRVKP